MVYVALIAALTTADPLHGAMVMAAFGLGTLPNVLAISAWFKYVAAAAKGRLSRVAHRRGHRGSGCLGIAQGDAPRDRVRASGQWCLDIPGIAAIFGGH